MCIGAIDVTLCRIGVHDVNELESKTFEVYGQSGSPSRRDWHRDGFDLPLGQPRIFEAAANKSVGASHHILRLLRHAAPLSFQVCVMAILRDWLEKKAQWQTTDAFAARSPGQPTPQRRTPWSGQVGSLFKGLSLCRQVRTLEAERTHASIHSSTQCSSLDSRNAARAVETRFEFRREYG